MFSFVLYRLQAKALHVALSHPHHCQDRRNQIYVVKTNVKGKNWKMNSGTVRIQFSVCASKEQSRGR